MSTKKTQKEIVSIITECGLCVVGHTVTNHHRFEVQLPGGGPTRKITAPITPSDKRWQLNARAYIRKTAADLRDRRNTK